MRRPALAVLAWLASGLAADAACYDVFGCAHVDRFRLHDLMSGPNCDFLYSMRNQIYAEHHYCFRTPRAIAEFGNGGCVSGDANAIGLNGVELANAATIRQAENAKGCPE